MILTETAITKIKDKRIRRELSGLFDTIDQVIKNRIKANKPNGPLTTFASVDIIKKHTGLKEDEILVDEKIPVSTETLVVSTE